MWLRTWDHQDIAEVALNLDNMADADNREEEDVREGTTSTTVTGVTVTVTSDSPQPPRVPEASPRPPVVEKTSVKVAFSQFSSLQNYFSNYPIKFRQFWRS